MIAVQVAAGLEWRALMHLLGNPTVQNAPVGRYCEIEVGTAQVVLLHAGTGKINAAAGAQYAILTWRPDLLVAAGTSGAVSAELGELDLVVANRTIVYDIESSLAGASTAKIESLTCDLEVPAGVEALPFPTYVGPVLTGDRDVTRANVGDLRTRFGALAGDWESGAVAKVCQMNGVRCLVLRSISDTPDSDTAGQMEKWRRNTPLIMERLWSVITAISSQGITT
jgi:adenosylhomocysteine nucleosidase